MVPVSPVRWPAALSPVVVVGGGLAGATAACLLGRAGRAVMLLERDAGPQHKICGEFISGEALGYLAGLGVDPVAHGAAPVGGVRLVRRGRVAESRLPFAAAGFSRFALDELLLHQAVSLGADVHRGVRVRSADAGMVQTDAGALPAATLFLATGKQDLRGLPRQLTRPPEELIGLKLHVRLSPAQREAVRGHVEVVLFDGGYGGLQLIEGGLANLCVLIDRGRYDAGAATWPGLLALLAGCDSHFARRLGDAMPCAERPLSIFRVPYGFVQGGVALPGVFRLGDQAAVIPSFCGDGMAIALHSAHLAVATVLRGGDAAAYQRRMQRDAGPPVRLAHGLYRLGRRPGMSRAFVELGRLWPGVLRLVARHTRVAEPGVNGC